MRSDVVERAQVWPTWRLGESAPAIVPSDGIERLAWTPQALSPVRPAWIMLWTSLTAQFIAVILYPVMQGDVIR